MAALKIWGFTVLKSNKEKDIQTFFDKHLAKLNEQKGKLLGDVAEWANATIRSIYVYANQQKYCLEQAYVVQVQNLQKTCKEFLDELHASEKRNDTDRINQLLEQCQALKFELSALRTDEQSVSFPVVHDERNLSLTNENDINVIDNNMERDLNLSDTSRSTSPKQVK